MNFIKRTFMAVSRRLGRTLILLVIFFIIANLVLTGFAIQHATTIAADNARTKIGGTITVSFNMQNAFAKARDAGGDAIQNIKVLPVTDKIFNQIASLKGFAYANKTVNAYALATGFDPVQPQGTDANSAQALIEKAKKDAEKYKNDAKLYQEKLKKYQDAVDKYKKQQEKLANQIEKGQFGGRPGGFHIEGGTATLPGMPGAPGMFNIGNASKTPDITVTGVSYLTEYSAFKEGASKMLQGKPVIASDDGKKECVIDTNLAKLNKLKLGSTIKVTTVAGAKTYSLKVIGIYQTADTQSTGSGRAIRSFAFAQPYNNVYTDVKTANLLKNGDGTVATGMDTAMFTAADPKNIDALVAQAKALNIDWNSYSLDANQAAYQQMVGPIQTVASTSMLVVLLVALAGALILCLLMLLSVKERMFETGVFMALGESRAKIVAQYVSEVLLIAIVAFALSFFSGQMIAQQAGNVMLNQQIQTIEEQKAAQQQNNMGGRGAFFGVASRSVLRGGADTANDQIKSIDVKITTDEMAKTFGLGLLIIFLGTLIPAITVMRFKPKKILTKAL
ncbi:MAG: FtsX-like permease family protein [Clostridia bacterium]